MSIFEEALVRRVRSRDQFDKVGGLTMQHSTSLRRTRTSRQSGTFGMTKAATSSPDQRSVTRSRTNDMLKQRQQMLVLLWELTKCDLRHVDDTVKEMLDEFSTILVDYIAAGHFGLYQRLIEGNERRRVVVDLAKEIYPRIAQTTEAAVAFSERFENADQKTLNAYLAIDLSTLAEHMSARIELEDQLIDAMLGSDSKTGVVLS
jgi:regulator of sigma D